MNKANYEEKIKEEQKKGSNIPKLDHWKIITVYLIIYDIVAIAASYFLALWFRFDCAISAIPGNYFRAYSEFIAPYILVCLIIFWYLRLYRSIWRYASYNELIRITLATGITFIIHTAGITLLCERMPISYYLMGIMLQFILITGIRFSYRLVLLIS